MLNTHYVEPAVAVEIAQLAERLGFDSIWVPETWGRDAVTYIARLALHTSRIQLASGVLPVFSRTPGLMAQTAASLDELTGGRFILGLGTSGPKVIEDWHGLPYDRPLRRTREYVAILRQALSGQRVNYDGELFQLHDFNLRSVRPVRQPLPIYVAALGPKNVELTGEIADGWLPIFLSLEHLDELKARLAAGAAKASRQVEDIAIAAFVGASVTGRVERDRELLRTHLAYYVGVMGNYYHRLVSSYGHEAEADAIRREHQAGRRQAAAAHVSDTMLDELAICGPPEHARARVAAYNAAGVTPLLAFPAGMKIEEIAATLEALG